jgi:thioredoxin-disulfide reductase
MAEEELINYDLIIIGGGPAGITAAIYSARKKIKTLLLTKDFLGQPGKSGEICNYPGFPRISGIELMKLFKEHLLKINEENIIEIKEGEEVVSVYSKEGGSFLVNTAKKESFSSKCLIVATGRNPRPLKVPGEREFMGKGVSYCSTCDAPLFKDKAVAVIGGGNSGFEAALDLAHYAKKIFIFERTDKLKADEVLQERVARDKKIEVHLNKDIKKIEGTGKVQDIVYQDLKTKKTYQLPIDGVFIQIGNIPATGFLGNLVEFNEWGEIKVDPQNCETSQKGIFAAGDVNDGKWKQIVIAASEGCRAALAAYDYLRRRN